MKERNTILIAEDVEINRELLVMMFEEQYTVAQAENGQVAIDYLAEHSEDVACLLLDLLMPVKDGFAVMEFMKENGMMEKIPIILITGDNSKSTEEKAYNYGAADVIYKPYVERVVMRRVKNIVDLYTHQNHIEDLVEQKTREIEQQAAEIRETNDLLIEGLGKITEFRTLESREHSKRVKMFTGIILHYVKELHPELGLTDKDMENIIRASVLHDIGKLGIQDSIVLKRREDRTEAEERVMRTHPTVGCEVLEIFDKINDKEFYQYCYDICKYHHENWDGSGYPNQVAGEGIPLAAQIVAIANTYDSLMVSRAYSTPFSHPAAVEEIMVNRKNEFSPVALECFDMAKEELYKLVEFKPEISFLS